MAETMSETPKRKRSHFLVPGDWASSLPHLGFRRLEPTIMRWPKPHPAGTLDVKPSFRGSLTAFFKRIGQLIELGRQVDRRRLHRQAADKAAQTAMRRVVKKL